MVDSKRYNPSNKRFQEHTKHFVEGTTLKGHLNSQDDKNKNKYKTNGELIRVVKAKIYENGWECKVDKKKINCNYGDNIIYLPPCKSTELYYIPTSKCEVEISIDEKSKIHTITKINDPNKLPISLTNEGVTLEGDGDASLQVAKDTVEISGNVQISGEVQDDITINTSNLSELPNKIVVTDMYKNIQSNNNDIEELKKQPKDIKLDTSEEEDLPDEISIIDMYKDIQILKGSIESSDSDAGDE